jgi:hypothetical protein
VGNPDQYIEQVFSIMVILVGMVEPVTNLGNMLGSILKNQEKIKNELEVIKSRLAVIEARLDEAIMVKARVAMMHLYEAANVDSLSIKSRKFGFADDAFSNLANLDPNGVTNGTSGAVPNKALICLGYWGKHLIMGMEGETRMAMIQAYQCVQSYPLEGMLVFPAVYFSKDYKAMIDLTKANEKAALLDLGRARKGNQEHNLERGVKIVEGLALLLGGVGMAAFTGNSSGLQAGMHLIRTGIEEVDGGSKVQINPYDTVTPQRTALTMLETQSQLSAEVIAECAARCQVLERVKISDLRKIIVQPAA